MAKAFLSHSSTDNKLVEKIANHLGRNNCHLDKLTFEAGRQTLDEIFRGLESSDIFVLFISNDSLESEWVKKEIRFTKTLLGKNVIDRIFPIIIDKDITYKDSRIPDWIKKPYNLKYFDNEVLILKKIKQFLRESNLKKHSHLKEEYELFVGRHDLMQTFERKMINIENIKPTCIVASSYFEGIGRRTFLRNGLIKTGIIDKWYDPITIPINSKESIEDFIYKLSFVENSKDLFKHDFSQIDLATKIEIAKEQITKIVNSGEVIFIIDEGSIILPNHEIANWFKELISDENFKNQVTLCIISKFKPKSQLIRHLGNILNFPIDNLTKPDTQIFFIQYLKFCKINLDVNDLKFFLQHLNGIPGQIIYTSNLIESIGVNEAKRNIYDIIEYDELQALSVLGLFDGNELAQQMLITFSKFEIISYDIVYQIFGESEEVYEAIQKLFDMSLFYTVSSTHEYLKLNATIADYINRSKLELSRKYDDKIKILTKEFISKPIELNENSDYSEFLFTLQMMISNNQPIPSKFFIPSFILKSMVQEYYHRKYDTVIELAKKVLENPIKFDYQIIRETRYWLCLAYARTKDEKFFDEIGFFKDIQYETNLDFYFLLGFYYRNTGRTTEAERNYLEALNIDNKHSRTKRELVIVYQRNGQYDKALQWAEENYYKYRTNILHIHAYFTSLIRQKIINAEDHEILIELLANAGKSKDKKSNNIYKEMQSEYDYYIEGNSEKAISRLEESLKIDPTNYFTFKALVEIHTRCQNFDEIDILGIKYPDLIEPEYE